jgi:DNA repair protein RadA/Sms
MPNRKVVFICDSCGAQQPKWQGQCPDCGAWNTLSEGRGPTRESREVAAAGEVALTRLDGLDATRVNRVSTGLGEFDRVLGGGLVPGGVVLLGGEPGIGKSTLLL